MRLLCLLFFSFLLAGCARPIAPPVPLATEPPDVSVSTVGVEEAALAAVAGYVERTNAILAGSASPDSIVDVTSASWAREELAGYVALDALGEATAPPVSTSRMEIARIRGTVHVVDVLLHVCFVSDGESTLTTLRLVPRDGDLIVDQIRAWEESTWCEPEPSLSF